METASGAGSIHNTPGIAFQENSIAAVLRKTDLTIPRTKKRSVRLSTEEVQPPVRINPNVSPPSFKDNNIHCCRNESQLLCEKLLLTWKSVRYLNASNQNNPRFVGWIVHKFQKANSEATKMTYLPPILTPITEYSTIIEMFYVSRQLAKQSNMTYTHITLDVGAAIKAFHVVWNNPEAWSDIIVHLGDFHAMMAFFGVIGTYVTGSGFEDVLFQAGLCSSGSITGVIKGKHYNRCWLVHEAFAEALERLFLERFMTGDTPESIEEFAKRSPDVAGVPDILTKPDVQAFADCHQAMMNKCLNGDFGKIPQYWAAYMKLVDRQHIFHYSVNTNDYDLRLISWRESLPLCFATNRVHYARYGTYYFQFLEHMDITHPGAIEEVERVGLSVRRNMLGIGQSIDLAGEQSYMRSAKTAGITV